VAARLLEEEVLEPRLEVLDEVGLAAVLEEQELQADDAGALDGLVGDLTESGEDEAQLGKVAAESFEGAGGEVAEVEDLGERRGGGPAPFAVVEDEGEDGRQTLGVFVLIEPPIPD